MKRGEKKGISTVIGTVILVAIVIGIGVVVWVIVNNVVTEGLESIDSCVDTFDQISLNKAYTCINTTPSYGESDVIFSINRKDIEIDKIIISVSGGGTTKSFTISSVNKTFTNLINYPYGTTNRDITMPGKNEGKTYIYNGTSLSSVDTIEIAPIIGNEQCETTDTATDLESCSIVIS